jgi:hypothetical protein
VVYYTSGSVANFCGLMGVLGIEAGEVRGATWSGEDLDETA